MSDEAACKRIGVIMPGIVWAVVLSQIKLALRHPGNVEGTTAEVAREFVARLEKILLDEGVYTREEIEELHLLEKSRMQ